MVGACSSFADNSHWLFDFPGGCAGVAGVERGEDALVFEDDDQFGIGAGGRGNWSFLC